MTITDQQLADMEAEISRNDSLIYSEALQLIAAYREAVAALKREQSFVAYKQRRIDSDDWQAGYASGIEDQAEGRKIAEGYRDAAEKQLADALAEAGRLRETVVAIRDHARKVPLPNHDGWAQSVEMCASRALQPAPKAGGE